MGNGLSYTQDLPTLGSSDVLGSYRGGSSCHYTPASKAYYPAMHAYGTPYPDDFEYGLGVPSPQVMSPESVGILPAQWGTGTRAKPHTFSSMYSMDTEGHYSSYNSTSLLHRPPNPVHSDSPNFSFSGVAASLPLTSTPGPDRLLPNPAGRSSTLHYPGAVKSSAPTSTSTATTLADVATAASYAGGFDTPGLSFSAATSNSLPSQPSSSSRSNPDTYSGPESIFSEQERSIQSQGPAFDMNGYTASPCRGSGAGVGSSGSRHAYVPGESAHEAAAHQHHLSGAYMGEASSGLISHPHQGLSLASGSSSAGHAADTDDRQLTAASRH